MGFLYGFTPFYRPWRLICSRRKKVCRKSIHFSHFLIQASHTSRYFAFGPPFSQKIGPTKCGILENYKTMWDLGNRPHINPTWDVGFCRFWCGVVWPHPTSTVVEMSERPRSTPHPQIPSFFTLNLEEISRASDDRSEFGKFLPSSR